MGAAHPFDGRDQPVVRSADAAEGAFEDSPERRKRADPKIDPSWWWEVED